MTGGAAELPRSAALAAPRNVAVRRFFIVHMLAYVLALPWGVAAVPAIFIWKEADLIAMPDEGAAIRHVVKLAAGPILAAFVLPHLFGIPWIRAGKSAKKSAPNRGWLLFTGSSSLLMATGLGIAVFSWVVLLRR